MKNPIYHHPGQPNMQVEVILASKGPDQKPVYTVRMRYPRAIHGEIMTHRVFGRNARSSRAVPVKTMLNEVRTIPYVPWHWGKNQQGMQAEEECNEPLINLPWEGGGDCNWTREQAWLQARDVAAGTAEAFMEAGYHKQNPNRLLEPFSWIDTLITATEWDNFLWLRNHEAAEPHLQDLAVLTAQALMDHKDKIIPLDYDEWHIPYVTDEERDTIDNTGLLMLSAARCCRISYKPFGEDQIDTGKDLQRFYQLTGGDRIHASPLEHQCSADRRVGTNYVSTHFFGEPEPTMEKSPIWEKGHLHGNLDGYVQFRKIFRGERFGR